MTLEELIGALQTLAARFPEHLDKPVTIMEPGVYDQHGIADVVVIDRDGVALRTETW